VYPLSALSKAVIRREIDAVPVGCCSDGVAGFHHLRVQLVNEDFQAESLAQFGGPADMIDVGVGEDQRGDPPRVDSRPIDVRQDGLEASSGAAVDHDRFLTEIDHKGGGTLGVRGLRSADQINVPGNRLSIRHPRCLFAADRF
jgi:hypothetical protein